MLQRVLLVGIVILVIALGAYLSRSNEIVVENENVQNVQEQEPQYPQEWLDEAEKAKQEVLRNKELEQELETVESEIEALEERKETLMRDLGTYWREEGSIKRLIKETFPEDPRTAIAIAECESGLNPQAYNPNNADGTTDGGLWQINDVHNDRLRELGLDKYDPEDATAYARMLYEESGWQPWICFTHKMIVMR